MPPKKKKDLDVFFMTFIGEYVQIFTSMQDKVVSQTEEEHIERTSFFSLEGYILDIDDEYYYIGERPDEITQAVKKGLVSLIRVVSESDTFDEILNGMPEPESDEGIN